MLFYVSETGRRRHGYSQIESGKRDFLPLLLLGDEQEDMIDRYLDRGTLLALYDGGLRAVCVVTKEAPGVFEIKNLAVEPAFQRQATAGPWFGMWPAPAGPPEGHAPGGHRGQCPHPPLLPGLRVPGKPPVPNFFLQFYDHPIYEGGRLLSDMVYLSMEL